MNNKIDKMKKLIILTFVILAAVLSVKSVADYKEKERYNKEKERYNKEVKELIVKLNAELPKLNGSQFSENTILKETWLAENLKMIRFDLVTNIPKNDLRRQKPKLRSNLVKYLCNDYDTSKLINDYEFVYYYDYRNSTGQFIIGITIDKTDCQ